MSDRRHTRRPTLPAGYQYGDADIVVRTERMLLAHKMSVGITDWGKTADHRMVIECEDCQRLGDETL